jgi:hypothetical protein
MRFHARISLLALLTGAIIAVLAPAAAQAAFGVESFFAGNCVEETCTAATPASKLFTQAAGHPNFGVTDFTLKSLYVGEAGGKELFKPEGVIEKLRVDVPPGISTDPQAVPMCSIEEFTSVKVGAGVYLESECKESTRVGTNKVTVLGETSEGSGIFVKIPLEGKVFNLTQPNGLPSLFGVAINLEPLGKGPIFSHTLIKGGVEWNTNYHEYFVIEELSKALPLVQSRLIYEGNKGTNGFLTNPSTCNGPQITSLSVSSYEGESAAETYKGSVGAEHCEAVPFEPKLVLTPETKQSDKPDGVAAEVTLPHNSNPTELDSSTLKTGSVTLPEGMTLDPSAAAGLEGCTPAQIGIGTRNTVSCPAASKVGTVTIEVPTLPPGSLTGNIYLGKPANEAITKPPYTIYLDAESSRYGLSVRVKGEVTPNETTGRLTAIFKENPEAPFSHVILHFNGGSLAPVANPLACGTATTETSLAPFTGTAAQSPMSSFAVDSNNEGGACPSPLPFTPSQGTENQIANAGAHTNYTFTLQRSEGQQYLSQVKTELPAGLVGAIPTVPLCTEAQANAESCPAESLIGKTTVTAGSGPTPFSLSGSVYLTGPYNGAPYGLFISVPVVAGPFNLGNAITRATINVDPTTARVIVASNLPTIVRGGVPVRLRSVSVDLDRPGFLSNPTSCGVLATESTVTGLGTPGTSVSLSSPFQVGNCSALPFKPSFKAATSAKTSKANGASLETTVNQPAGQANIKSVLVQLPKQLPSRLTTLQKACPEATFAANPLSCPTGSLVGGARANTPLLPNKLTGPAYLVSHGGAAFPDLDIVLQADGVRVILVGNTNIKGGITTTNFATTPDVPVSSITLNLPVGAHSALAAYGELCAQPLVMPTTITAQDGSTLKQNTIIKVAGCGVRIVGHKVIGNTAYLTVRTFAAGRISGRGSNLATSYRYLGKPEKTATLKVPLSSRGQRRGRPLRVRLRVGFLAKQRGIPSSAAFVTVTFR